MTKQKQKTTKQNTLPRGKRFDSKAFMKDVRRIRALMLKNDPDRFKEYE